MRAHCMYQTISSLYKITALQNESSRIIYRRDERKVRRRRKQCLVLNSNAIILNFQVTLTVRYFVSYGKNQYK